MKITHNQYNIQHTAIEFDKRDLEKLAWDATSRYIHFKAGKSHVVKEFYWDHDDKGSVALEIICKYNAVLDEDKHEEVQ